MSLPIARFGPPPAGANVDDHAPIEPAARAPIVELRRRLLEDRRKMLRVIIRRLRPQHVQKMQLGWAAPARSRLSPPPPPKQVKDRRPPNDDLSAVSPFLEPARRPPFFAQFYKLPTLGFTM